MPSFFPLCQKRSSVRSFRSTLPSAADIDYIVECTRLAPSAVNRQPWRIYYTTDTEILGQLYESYPREWLQTAPATFVLCKKEEEQWVRPSDGHAHGDIDVAIATEHLCLAAAERGLGTCWVCNFDLAKCRKALQLDESETPVVIVPIGYAADQVIDAGRKRKKREEVFFHK